MFTNDGGLTFKVGEGKITIRKNVGRDLVRGGADRLPGWTEFEAMVMMTALCILEACCKGHQARRGGAM